MASGYTPRLGLPQMADGEQSGYVTFNELAQMLDAQLNAVVQSDTVTDPPGAPAEGQCWLIPDGATGAWVGNEGKIAQWYNAAWWYYDATGVLMWVIDSGQYRFPARADPAATMGLVGVSVTGIALTTVPTAFAIADTGSGSTTTDLPTLVDLANSRFTLQSPEGDIAMMVNVAISIDGPSGADKYLAAVYKNGVAEGHLRSAMASTTQYSAAQLVIAGILMAKAGDVLEVRLSMESAGRTVAVDAFNFTILPIR